MANGDPSQMPDEGGGAPPGGPPGAGGPPGMPGGGPPGMPGRGGGGVLAALQQAQQTPQPTSPGQGDMGDALMKVKSAMEMLQAALPGLTGTQHYSQVAHMLSRLSKITPQGAPTAGVQQTMHKDLGRNMAKNWLLQQVMQNQGPQQQQPMPQMPLPGA